MSTYDVFSLAISNQFSENVK